MRLILILSLSLLTLAARAEWQQQAVASAVDELSTSVAEIIILAEDQKEQLYAIEGKHFSAALIDLKQMHGELERLQLELQAGKNRVQTAARYRRISSLRRSVRDYAEGTQVSEVIQEKAIFVRKSLRELDLLYVE